MILQHSGSSAADLLFQLRRNRGRKSRVCEEKKKQLDDGESLGEEKEAENIVEKDVRTSSNQSREASTNYVHDISANLRNLSDGAKKKRI